MAEFINRNLRSSYRPSHRNWEEDRYGRDFNEDRDYGNQSEYFDRGSYVGNRYDRDADNYSRFARNFNDEDDYERRRYGRGENYGDYRRGYDRDYGRESSDEEYQGRRGREYHPWNEYRRYGQRSYEGNRYYPEDRNRRDWDRDRSWWDKASDEVSSWFGDDEAERRRVQDKIESGKYRGKGPRGYKRSDERIREDINDRLSDDPYIDATDIEVQVENGDVTLTGTVNNRDDKRRAEYISEMVSGVVNVENRLRLNQMAFQHSPEEVNVGNDQNRVRQETKF